MSNPQPIKSKPLVPPDGWMEIGSIVGAHGIKGEVKVYPNSDFPERFTKSGEMGMWNLVWFNFKRVMKYLGEACMCCS
jgi:ribosomal 30S subunit maturation factor RimM